MEEDLLIVPSGSPESYCRLCFSESNIEPLLVRNGHGPQPNQALLDLIRKYVAIRLDPNIGSHPCAICSTCRMMLEEFQRFRERCLRCDYVLTGELRDENEEQPEEQDPNEEKMCHRCRMAFSTVSEMRTHFRLVHGQNMEQKHKCPSCPMKFSDVKRLDSHRKTHDSDRPFRCHVCAADFKSNHQLKRHRDKWHEASKVYECLHCPRVFATEMHMNLHDKSMHGLTKMSTLVPSQVPPAKKAKKTTETPVPITLPIISSVVLEPTIPVEPPLANESSKPFECTTCKNRFHFVGSIKRHIREVHKRNAIAEECEPLVPVHPAIVPLQSPVVTLPLAADLFQVQSVEPTELYQTEPLDTIVPDIQIVPPPAVVVPKVEPFSDPRVSACLVYLERLDESIIPPIPNYEIPIGKYYHALQKKTLAHGHAPEPLEDDELAQLYPEFVQAQTRQVFPCKICGKELYSHAALKKHLARHKNQYPCPECGRSFFDKASLDRHMPIHTNDFPHKCDECPLGFVRPQLLTVHKERYHGPNAKPLNLVFCPVCHRAYTNMTSMGKHLGLYHPEYDGSNAPEMDGMQQMEVDEEAAQDMDEEAALLNDENLMLDAKSALLGMLL